MAEFNLGTLSSTPKLTSDNVGSGDPSDTFSFNLDKTSNLNASLTNMRAGKDADIRIYRDVDNNGLLDKSIDTEIGKSTRGGNLDDSINLGSVSAGNYLAEVKQAFTGQNTGYRLGLSATDPTNVASETRASNLLPAEVNVGTLNNFDSRTFNGSVGNNNTADVYRVNVNGPQDLSVSLTGLSSDADVRLIQDKDGDRVIDPNETIRLGSAGGSASESFAATAVSGDLFIQVYQFSGNTNYQLGIEAHPIAR